MTDRQTIYESFGEVACELIDSALTEMPSHTATSIKKLLTSGDARLELKLVLPEYHIQCDIVTHSERTSLFTVEAEAIVRH